ncbi:MAG: hypothetical protein LBS55_06930 [Prevotellaceae bacterium]|nr:hypothetical protein [Prevotellaceae bacterium]
MILVFCLSLLPFAFIYSQSEVELDCTPNIENIFKVHDLKIKYRTVQYMYKNRGRPMMEDHLNSYFELIRGYPLFPERQDTITPEGLVYVKLISKEEADKYIEQLNFTPEQALDEYKRLIRNIKSEKEICLKCIDTEIEKGDLSEYASAVILYYGFMPRGWSVMPRPTNLSKLDFLKVFKEFIFNRNEDVLPEGTRVVRYLNRLAQGDVNSEIVHEFEFDKESFLIGTLSDYMGHQQTFTVGRDSSFIMNMLKDSSFVEGVKASNIDLMANADAKYQFIDGYSPNEKNLALLIQALFAGEFSDLYMTDGDKGIRLHSAFLAKIINNYYDYRAGSSKTVFLDTIYQGYLKPEKLQTISQKLSFLTGAMLRDGYQSESEGYYLSMPNSVSKAKLCSELLLEFKCNNIVYKRYVDYIPCGNMVYFEPSEIISKLIEKVKTVKENLENDEAAKLALIAKIE